MPYCVRFESDDGSLKMYSLFYYWVRSSTSFLIRTFGQSLEIDPGMVWIILKQNLEAGMIGLGKLCKRRGHGAACNPVHVMLRCSGVQSLNVLNQLLM